MADEAASYPVASKQRRLERQQRQQMIQVARQPGRALVVPRPCLRGAVMHPDQGPAGKAALQAQGEFGRAMVSTRSVWRRSTSRAACASRRHRRGRSGSVSATLPSASSSETGSAGHSPPCAVRPRRRTPGARRLLAKCLHQPRADRIAPPLTGQQKDPPGHLLCPNRPLRRAARRVDGWTDHRLDAVAGCAPRPEPGQANGNGAAGGKIAPPATTTPESATRSSAMQACSCVMADP